MAADELNDKQLAALELLVAGATQQRAADLAAMRHRAELAEQDVARLYPALRDWRLSDNA